MIKEKFSRHLLLSQVFCLLLGSSSLLASCEFFEKTALDSEMQAVQQAIENIDWPLAERLLQGLLYENTDRETRWDLWLQLLEVQENQDAYSHMMVQYLESMLTEFEDSPEYLNIVLEKLAHIYLTTRHYERAFSILEQQQGLKNLHTQEKQSEIFQDMGTSKLHLNEFKAAIDNLNMCLGLSDLPNERYLECHYDLANVYYVQGLYDEALAIVQKVYTAEGVSDTLRAHAGFMLADCLSALGKKKDAIVVLRAIQKIYPNELVIVQYIDFLESGKKQQPSYNRFINR